MHILVGPSEQTFTLPRKLVCSTSPFFRTHFKATLPSSPSHPPTSVLRLPETLPATFELFTLHLHHPRTFTTFINTSIASLAPSDPDTPTSSPDDVDLEPSRLSLHWTLVHLHLFAASITHLPLQDAAMDAIQDLYLHYDWEVSPSFVRYLYTLDPLAARRLRKWAIAMVAWSISLSTPLFSDETPADWQEVLDEIPEFQREYTSHLEKMAGVRRRGGDENGADVRVKNPQLRLPANKLKAEERYFGFRLCSFHSHRGTVGERPCPHAKDGSHEEEGWYDVVDLESKGEKEAVRNPAGELTPPSSAKSAQHNAAAGGTKPSEPAERHDQETKLNGTPALSHRKPDMEVPPPVPKKNSFQLEIKLDIEGSPAGVARTQETKVIEVPPLVPKKTMTEMVSRTEEKVPKQRPKANSTTAPNTPLPPTPQKKPKKKPSTVSMLIRDGFYLDVS